MGIMRTRYIPILLVGLALPAALPADAAAWEADTVRSGSTFQTLPLAEPGDNAIEQCAALCGGEERCASWTFVRPGNPDRGASEFGLCLLKDAVPEAVADICCVSGVKGAEEGATAKEDAPAPTPGGPPWIGLQIQDVTDAVAEQTGAAAGTGVYVVKVGEGGPADQAGIRQGDIITGFGGEAVSGAAELARAVAARSAGDRVEIAVERAGTVLGLTVEIGARPAE